MCIFIIFFLFKFFILIVEEKKYKSTNTVKTLINQHFNAVLFYDFKSAKKYVLYVCTACTFGAKKVRVYIIDNQHIMQIPYFCTNFFVFPIQYSKQIIIKQNAQFYTLTSNFESKFLL